MAAEPAGKELIDTSGGVAIATATASRARPGTLGPSRFLRSRDDGRDHAAMLGHLQHIPVLYP
jgi:hypothetical protein